jgi:uncharacterized coiled-coil protein SlyX
MKDSAIVDLQMQLTHLERFVDQLNEVITAQARQIDHQQRILDRLLKSMDETKSKSPGDAPLIPEDEKPPHY